MHCLKWAVTLCLTDVLTLLLHSDTRASTVTTVFHWVHVFMRWMTLNHPHRKQHHKETESVAAGLYTTPHRLGLCFLWPEDMSLTLFQNSFIPLITTSTSWEVEIVVGSVSWSSSAIPFVFILGIKRTLIQELYEADCQYFTFLYLPSVHHLKH